MEREMFIEQEHFFSSSKSKSKKKGMRKKAAILVGTRDGENTLTTAWCAEQE